MTFLTASPASVVPKPLRTELGRSALLERLSPPDMSVIALLAPSGYGKTTLLAQYVRSSVRPTVWLTLTESDSDVGYFIASLSAACLRHLGTAHGVPGLPVAPELFIPGLLNALAEMPRSVDLVFDRAEVIGPDVGRLLTPLLSQLPEGHRVLLGGYNGDHLPLARLIAAGRASVIDQTHLAFSEHEARMLLEARGFGGDPQRVIAALEGWPAGTALAASGGGLSIEPRDLVLETLSTLSPALQQVLPEASVLPIWSEEEARGGPELPPGWLDDVRRSGLPLTPLGQGVYRPHLLLLAALGNQLQRTPERANALHRWRSDRCAAVGDRLAALRHAKRAADWRGVSELLETELPRLYARNEFALIRALTQDLPRSSLPTWAEEYRAAALVETGAVELGEEPLHALYRRGEASAVGYTALTLLAVRRGQIDEQLRLAEAGIACFPALQTFSLRLQRVSALTSLGRAEDGLAAGETLVAEARGRGARLDEARALVMLQYVHQVLGQWTAREACIRAAHHLFEALGQRVRGLETLSLLAEIEAMAGRTAAAHALLDQAVAAAQTEQPIMLAPLRATRATVYLAQGDAVRADQELVAALDTVEGLALDLQRPFLQLMRFDTLLTLGQPAGAYSALMSAQATELPLIDTYLPFYQGRWAFATAQPLEATRAFTQVAAHYPDRFRQVRAQAYLCELARTAGTLTPAHLEGLAQALNGLNSAAVLALEREVLVPLAHEAAQRTPGHPLTDLIGPELRTPDARRVLDIQVLGRLEVRLGAQVIKMPLQKSAELLVWLAWHGEGRLGQLLDALWDGSNDPRHHDYFRVAVRRLRARLTSDAKLTFDPIPYDGRVYRISPELDVRFDVQQWLRDLASPDMSLVLAALPRTPGELLLGIESEWVQPLREAWNAEGLRAVLCTTAALAQRAPLDAAALCRRALSAFPDSEALHSSLIQALGRSDPAQARQAYHDYVKMMRREYGAEPSGALRQLAAEFGS